MRVYSFVRRIAERILPSNIYGVIARYVVHPIRRIMEFRRPVIFSLPRAIFGRYQYPLFLSIELTTRCNMKCFICRREGFKGKDLHFEDIYKLHNAIKFSHTIDLTGWGEPLLYPRLEDVLNYIYSLNARENLIQITTNGSRLSGDLATLLTGHLKLLIISMNAATASTYDREMKGANFEETLLRIKSFMSTLIERDQHKVVLHFVAHTENFHEIPDLIVLANKLSISRVTIGQYLISIPEHRQYNLLHVKSHYNAVLDQAQNLGTRLGVQMAARRFFIEKHVNYQQCWSPFIECYIKVDGEVVPCCFCGNYRIGNAYEAASFEDIWFSEGYRKLRKKRYLPACQKCSPFIPFDEYQAHFTAYFKETNEFKEFERKYISQQTPVKKSEWERTAL